MSNTCIPPHGSRNRRVACCKTHVRDPISNGHAFLCGAWCMGGTQSGMVQSQGGSAAGGWMSGRAAGGVTGWWLVARRHGVDLAHHRTDSTPSGLVPRNRRADCTPCVGRRIESPIDTECAPGWHLRPKNT